MLDSKTDEGGQIPKAEFYHESASVGLYRLGGDEKNVGHFGAGFALGHELKDFPFPVAQFFDGAFTCI